MDGVSPIGRGSIELRQRAAARSESASKPQDSGIKSEKQAAPRPLIPAGPADKAKLFTSGSLPLHGLYDVVLIDKNKDGRVDAGDAINEYLLLATKAKEEAASKQNKNGVDEVA